MLEWGTRAASQAIAVSEFYQTKVSELSAEQLAAAFAGPFDDPGVRIEVLDGQLEVSLDGDQVCVALVDDAAPAEMVSPGACPES